MSEGFDPATLVGRQTAVGEIIAIPTWDAAAKEWRALVAATPGGPLLLVAFKVTVEGER